MQVDPSLLMSPLTGVGCIPDYNPDTDFGTWPTSKEVSRFMGCIERFDFVWGIFRGLGLGELEVDHGWMGFGRAWRRGREEKSEGQG